MADLNSTRRVTAEFTAAGIDTDPTTLVLTITAPDGTVTTPTPVHDSAGNYHYDLLLNQTGIWTIEWTGTGAVPVEETTTITVDGASFEGPCLNWITWGEVSEYCTPPDISPALQDSVLRAATRTVWERSCKQFGVCTITRARVTPRCGCGYVWRTGWGYYPTGGYGSIWPGGCGCGGYALGFVDLGVEPVVSVDSVWIDGVVLDPANYRVDDWRRLVRTDGLPWPASTLQPDQGEPNTLEVTWTYGVPVPDDGKMAVALYACKLAKEAAGDCEPSANATQINREGVTITISPPKGDTGIVLVEQWLGNFHCGGGGIFDPGAHKATVRVNT